MVDECWVLSTDKNTENESKKLFDFISEKIKNDYGTLMLAADLFEQHNLNDFAIKLLQDGETIFGSTSDITNRLANLYLTNGQRIKAMERYLTLMIQSNIPFEQFKQVFESNITDSADFVALQQLLIVKIQENPNVYSLNDWLKWSFIKQQDWKNAFIFTKAIDSKLNEDGKRLFDLGILCTSNNELEIALKCFDYCVKLAQNSHDPNLVMSYYLNTKFQILTKSVTSPEEWNQLIIELTKFESENGPSSETLPIAQNLANIYIQRKNNPTEAVSMLQKYVNNTSLDKKVLANAKISLAKAEIANNEMWKSELLLAQVEKDFSEEALGQQAKFYRAELSFFRGDYDWASMQLDVLKDATTQLISNDAMELALCITDNVGTDSNYTPLQLYSKALLFQRQNRFDSAIFYVQKIRNDFQGHSLTDEILLLKARIYESQENYEKAVDTYETLAVAFSHDILADNALIALANLYQYKMKNSDKAIQNYKKIIENHSNSIFITEARKEYRKLRGF
jgi:tetratricopeptide (TPR) repeat protein